MTTLAGKHAFVTGAGSGIGQAIAERFANLGAHVWATDLDEAAAAETVRRIRAAGGSADALALDVTSPTAAARTADAVLARAANEGAFAPRKGDRHAKRKTSD